MTHATPTAEEIWREQKAKYDEKERERLADEAKKRADKDAEKDEDVLKKRAEKKQLLALLIPTEDDRKKLIFGSDGIGESSTGEYSYAVDKQVFNVSDKTALTFGLNSTKKFVLGDNTSITLLNGLNLDVNLSINIASATTKRQDKARVSFTGIAKSLTVGAADVAQLELDSVHPNQVIMPDLNNLQLSYGNINTVASERLLGVEFLRKEDESFKDIELDKCNYASFRLVTRRKMERAALKDVPLLDGLTSADDEYIQKYISNTGNLFEGCGKVNLPNSLEGDVGLTQGGIGTNIVQYLCGIGRIAYEKMDGISKSVTYATDQYSNVYCKGAKFTVMCSPHSTESIQTINSSNTHTRLFNTSMAMASMDLSSTFHGVKITPSVIGFDMSASASKKFKTHTGVAVDNTNGLLLEQAALHSSVAGVRATSAEVQVERLEFSLEDSTIEAHASDVSVSGNAVAMNRGRITIESAEISLTV